MSITGFTWAQFKGGDIHVLRNDEPSVRLDETLIVVEELTNLTISNINLQFQRRKRRTVRSARRWLPSSITTERLIGMRSTSTVSFSCKTIPVLSFLRVML